MNLLVLLLVVLILVLSGVSATSECVIDSLSFAQDTHASLEGQHIVLVDAAAHSLSCIDGRDTTGILGTPGGDSGEFLAAIAALQALLDSSSRTLQPDEVAQYFHVVMAHLELQYPTRKFYLHSDSHATERLFKELGINSSDATDSTKAVVDIIDMPVDKQPQALGFLQQAEYTGCGHLKLILTHPEQYGIERTLTQAFIQEFYRTLWQQATIEDNFLHHKVDQVVVLQGNHQEKCIWQISSKDNSNNEQCEGLEPLVAPQNGKSACFVQHVTATKSIRDTLAVLFYELAKQPQEFTVEKLREEIDTVAAKQLELTISYLAKDDPIYQVTVLVKPSSEFLSNLPWILVGAVLVLIGAALVVVAVFAARNSKTRDSDRVASLELEDH